MRLPILALALLGLTAAPAAAQSDPDRMNLRNWLVTPAGPNGAIRGNARLGGARRYAEPPAPAPTRSTGIFAQHEVPRWADLTQPVAPPPQP